MNIVLASASPRRRELLEMLRAPGLVVLPAAGEEAPPPGAAPAETVKALALHKAREVAALRPAGDVIIGADTVVALDGRILGKPRDGDDAFEMLSALSGREHRVYTGVAVLRGGRELCEAEETAVRFRPLRPEEIRAYIATGEPMDKAGAYGAQGRASLFVRGIDGDFFNVMGLPLFRLGRMLETLDVRLI